MISNIDSFIISQGIFAVLFTYLLLYILKTNSEREHRYQNILTELAIVLSQIKEDIDIMKNLLKK